MANKKSFEEILQIRKAGRIVAACHREISRRLKPGISTLEIDRFVEWFLERHGAKVAQKGYKGFPYATCASVNHVVCHGYPDDKPLQSGDIVTIDIVAEAGGWMADSAWTYPVGIVSPGVKRLVRTAELALYRGISEAAAGNRIGDIGYAVQHFVERSGFKVIEDFVGHGIGRSIHEWPQVFHSGKKGSGIRLNEGMVITVEPIVTMGNPEVWTVRDGWTVRTLDGQPAAQFEHTVAVTRNGPVILTRK